MTQDKTFLGTEPIGKLLVKLAVPTVVAQLVNRLIGIALGVVILRLHAQEAADEQQAHQQGQNWL